MMARVITLTERDKGSVLDLIREAHGTDIADRHASFWDWRIEGNPWFVPQQDYRLGLESEGRVMGAINLIPARVKMGDNLYPALCPLDLVVSPAAKQRSVATGSLMISGAVARMQIPILYGGTLERAAKPWARAFGVDPVIGRYRTHHRVLAWGTMLRQRRGVPGWLAACAGLVPRAAGALASGLLALRSPRDVTIKPVEEFGPEFDTLWNWAASGYPNLLVRNSEFLNWRFRRFPGRSYTALGAYRGGKLVGYAVLRWIEDREVPAARIVDLFTHHDDVPVFRRLLRAALAEAQRRGAAMVSMLEVMQPEFRRELRLALFFRGRSHICMIGRSLAHAPAEFYDASRWWITLADCDLDTAQ